MQTVLDDFNKRAKEITDYIVFIRDLENQSIKINMDGNLLMMLARMQRGKI